MPNETTLTERVVARFREAFQEEPTLVVRGPGRINLIGEHTDYNGGFVLPAAIDRQIFFAIGPRTDQQGVLLAENLGDTYRFDTDNPEKAPKGWPNYLIGVVDQLRKVGRTVGGFNLVFGGNIPTGAGVSSSAALECGVAFALNQLYSLDLTTLEMVQLSQRAENQFVGVNCGIMDQFASMFGRENSVIRLDCRDLSYEYFPFRPAGYSLLLCDTGVKHSLGSSEYNTRRQECERGVALLKRYDDSIQTLRDVPKALLEAHRAELEPKVYDRCRYVVEEIERVQVACDYLLADDLAAFGKKMIETHEGLQHLYEVSCEELDFLVDQIRNEPAVLGGRMMGGGFGGCTINLLRTEAVGEVVDRLSLAYKRAFGIDLVTHLVRITDGTALVAS